MSVELSSAGLPGLIGAVDVSPEIFSHFVIRRSDLKPRRAIETTTAIK